MSPFTGPQGQEFEDFEDCVDSVEDWDGIDDPEAVCGSWQADSKTRVDKERIRRRVLEAIKSSEA